jgi:phasin
MTETPVSTKSKPKAAAATANVFEMPKFDMPKFDMPKFDMPKFDMPKFEMPKFEMPTAFREFAEKGVATAKENYAKMKTAAEEATDVMEETYSTASKGCSGYGAKVIDAARANSNAAFDLYGELLTAKSYAEVVELTTAYMRAQYETVTAQAKELAEEAQKVASETAEPIKESFTSAISKAA